MLLNDYEHQGFAIVPDVLTAADVRRVAGQIETVRMDVSAVTAVANRSGVYALRNLTDVVPEVRSLLSHASVADLVRQVLGPGAFMTRSTLFDKTDGANWGVFWHQDLSIAVSSRHAVEGFTGWTRKAGVFSVQPPTDLMRRILAMRLHLDDCTSANGALRVLPGTHRAGQLRADELDGAVKESSEVICEVQAGGAVLMNPLTLHASSPMTTSGQRRVIHFEFASFSLPAPLEWKYQIPCG